MAEDLGEKTELPTARKMSDARERGQVAKSQDLAAAIDLIGAVALLVFFGASITAAIRTLMLRVFEAPADLTSVATIGALLRSSMYDMAVAMAPSLGLIVVVGLVAQLMQVGMVFSVEALQPKLSRLNPISGLGRLFDRKNMVKSAVSLLKLVFVVAVATLYLRGCVDRVALLPLLGVTAGMATIGRLALELAAWLLAVLLILGVVDWLFQRWQHTQDLKMTKDEVKDERRSMEGDPAVKSRRYKLMREIALQRINQSVPKADVIVTNPTHVSVAIQYDAATMKAPRVVAKGVDHMAMRIRQVAMVHRVPIVERPPLARALFSSAEVGQEIAPEFFQAIAEVLAYVYRLEREAA